MSQIDTKTNKKIYFIQGGRDYMERIVMRVKYFWEYIAANFDLKHRNFNILQINLHKI